MTNSQYQLVVFGDQAVPYYAELQKLLLKKDNLTLATFLQESYLAIRTELSRLPFSQRAEFPNSTTLAELLIAHRASRSPNCALDSALVVLHQIASFVSYVSENQTEYPRSSSATLIGSCIGLLTATAVSVSQSIVDLVSVGPEFVVLAFRIGQLVQSKTTSVSIGADETASYSSVIGGTDKEAAARLIEEYNQATGLPASARLYISAIGQGSLTVSGGPTQLDAFFAQNNTLKRVKVPVTGLFHSAVLHNVAEGDGIVASFGAETMKRVARLPVLSNSSGKPIAASTCELVLQTAVEEILTKQLRWDLIVEKASAISTDTGIVVLPFASGSVQSLATATSQSGAKAVKIEDTAVRPAAEESKRSKIAIIGFSGRFPEADDNSEFWQLLLSGLDVHKEIPADRCFDPWKYYDPTGKKKNTSGVTKGNFIKNPKEFDARFFGMSPREAEQADPAQRLALMTAYECMEMAGFVPDKTPSTQRDRVGVFYGTASDDYRETNAAQNIDTYYVPGGSRAFLPARINYFFRFSGPSFDVDTACSSGLAAVHIACNSLWRGDCDTAIAGGTNVLTNPDNWAGLDRAHFLSRTGNCKTFDDGADGYCRAESVSTVLLKRLEDAQLDGDPIFGVILGAYTNHSAEAVSMTRPHSGAQRAIFSRILNGAGVDGNEVSYVEMHGTGTQAGDACEMDSVLSVFAPPGTRREKPVHLGSAKANIGHAESASGVSSLIKVLLMMENSTIPPHVGIKTKINRNFPTDLTERNVHIAFKPTPWTRPLEKQYGRRAFVNNFGAAGGNSSVLLEDAPIRKVDEEDPRPLHMVAVTAKTQSSLKRNIRTLREHLDANPNLPLGSLSYTTTARRTHHDFRVIVSGSETSEVRNALQALEAKETFLSSAASANNKTVGFTFTGQGSQNLGMGKALLQLPQFKSIVQGLEDILRLQGFSSVLPILDGTCATPLEELSPATLQLSITCLQIALFRFWKSLGISPQVVVGHSLGEYAAMNAAGVLSDADTIHIVGTRATLLEKHCTVGTHSMLAIKAPADKVASLITSWRNLEIACINGPEETVVAGSTVEIERFTDALSRVNIKGTPLKVQFAFHSSQVEPMLEAFKQACRSVTFRNPTVPLVSPLLGKVITSAEEFGVPTAYLARHCRETVNFRDALQAATLAQTITEKTIWVELGPHPITSNMVKNIIGGKTKTFPSLRRNEDELKIFISTLNGLYESGLQINWSEYHVGFQECLRVLRLPAYQWELKEYWIDYKHDWCLTKGDAPLLPAPAAPVVEVVETPSVYTASVQQIISEKAVGTEASIVARSDVQYKDLKAVLLGHRINGRALCPSSVYADMALTLFGRLLEKSTLADKEELGCEVANMVVDKSLLLSDEATQLIELRATANWATRTATFSLHSVTKDCKVTANHCQCTGAFTSKKQWVGDWKRRDFLVKSRIGALRKSVHDDEDAAHLFKTGMFYKLFTCIVEYTEHFKGLRELVIRSEDLECTSKVKFATAPGEGDKWVCPPYWIESLGQITGFTLNANDSNDSNTQVFINHGWDNMRIAKKLSPDVTYRTYLKMDKKNETEFSGDVYILDDTDEIIGMYEGVTFSALQRKILDIVLPPVKAGGAPFSIAAASSAAAKPAAPRSTPKPVAQPVQQVQPVAKAQAPSKPAPNKDALAAEANKVRVLISEEVGVPLAELKDQDDEELVNLGVDSLLALTMSDRIREDFGVTVDSTEFMGPLTVKGLIALVVKQGEPSVEATSEPEPVFEQEPSAPPAAAAAAADDETFSAEADKVRVLISEEVGVPLAEMEDDEELVNLGVDSLLALTMSDRIREDFGVTVDSTAFMGPLTVKGLIVLVVGEPSSSSSENASASSSPVLRKVSSSTSLSSVSSDFNIDGKIGQNDTGSSSFVDLSIPTPVEKKIAPPATSVLLQGNPNTATKTFWLFPDGSGLATSYLPLPDVDTKTVAVYGLSSPFIKKADQMSEYTFEDLTGSYLTEIRRRQPNGPYYLGGWSAGGISAYDAAQNLVAAGQEVRKLILLDSPNPINLAKLPSRLYDDFNRLNLFGAAPGKQPPAWLIAHFTGFVNCLDTYAPVPYRGGAARPLKTSVIWAQDGVAENGEITVNPSDPPNLKWLVLRRTEKDLGANGWDQLVGRQNINIEVLKGANHFSMMKDGAAAVSKFIGRAMN